MTLSNGCGKNHVGVEKKYCKEKSLKGQAPGWQVFRAFSEHSKWVDYISINQ